MKMTIYIILFCIFSLPMHSQEKKKGNTLDSILSLIDDRNLTLKEKLELGDQAAGLSYADYTKVLRRLIHYGKQENDKSSLINTYCTLYNVTSLHEKDVRKGKIYLDSAYALIDQTNDLNIKGVIFYCLGKHYANLPESEEISHEHLYKAIQYFEQSGTNSKRLVHIYFMLGNAYINRKDMEGTKKIIDKMTAVKISKQASERVFLINVYSVIADYYDLAKANDSINYYSYNDSIIHYSKKMIDTYESLLDSVPGLALQKAPIVRYYNELALALADTKNTDWSQVMESLEKGKSYIDSTAHRDLMKYYSAKGRIFLKQKKFHDAKASFLKEKELLVNSDEYDDTKLLYIQLYLNLSSSYEGLKQYKEALFYTQMVMDAERKFNEQNRYETVKDIETKYETAEKELEISRLDEEKQETRFKISMMLSVGILSILSLFFAFLYNRMKHLRKKKEAILLTAKINEKELENQSILKESELKQMRHYLDGLEVERNRLSKDLHDVVANKLYILDQNIQGIDNIPESIFKQIEDLYNQTRNISHELISPSFHYTTLSEILFNFIEETKESTNLQFHLNISPENYFDGLAISVSHEIYRIIQESIGNIIKHSSAQNTWIDLSYSDNTIYLEVKDDGEGFDIQKRAKGIGLQIIQNRCNSLNGKLIINTEIGKGCSIKITIPATRLSAD